MKESSRTQASHVNAGTSVKREDLGSNTQRGREFRHPKLHAEVESSESTSLGGLALATSLVRGLKFPQLLDKNLNLLKQHRPFTESDHVLIHVYNLFLGGTAVEDIGMLQSSEPVRRMVGASRLPDPTTAGDFLRRFTVTDLDDFNTVLDQLQRKARRKVWGRRKRNQVHLDLDSHIHEVHGNQKEGADFSYKGTYGYHPLVASLGETQEILRIVNRPGNVTSAEGAAELLDELLPFVSESARRVIVRGDSAFAQKDIFEACEDYGQYFAIVSPQHSGFENLANSILPSHWRPFRWKPSSRNTGKNGKKQRRRGKNRRRRKARARGKRDLQMVKQWTAEVPYEPQNSPHQFRLIIRKQKIKESNQGELFDVFRYSYVVSNLPPSYSAEEVIRHTYRRADQENVIEQLKNGIGGMKMPTGSFLANSAYLICARLAFNLKTWLAQLALPNEVMRWQWKRFRHAFVYVAARVIHTGRATVVRFADSHRFAQLLRVGIVRLNV